MASIGAAIRSAGTIVLLLGMLFLISPARCQSEEESKSVSEVYLEIKLHDLKLHDL